MARYWVSCSVDSPTATRSRDFRRIPVLLLRWRGNLQFTEFFSDSTSKQWCKCGAWDQWIVEINDEGQIPHTTLGLFFKLTGYQIHPACVWLQHTWEYVPAKIFLGQEQRSFKFWSECPEITKHPFNVFVWNWARPPTTAILRGKMMVIKFGGILDIPRKKSCRSSILIVSPDVSPSISINCIPIPFPDKLPCWLAGLPKTQIILNPPNMKHPHD